MIKKILNHLWMVCSLIIGLNGVGICYVGAKTSNEKWILEGFIYELPWIFSVMFYNNPRIAFAFSIICIISMLIAIIRSLIINPDYQEIIANGNYRKSKSKFTSCILIVLSAIPFINGIGFIFFASKFKDKRLLVEGIFYESLWILGTFVCIFNIFLATNILAIVTIFSLVSLLRALIVNYSRDIFSYPVGRVTNSNHDNSNRSSTMFEDVKSNDKNRNDSSESIGSNNNESVRVDISDSNDDGFNSNIGNNKSNVHNSNLGTKSDNINSKNNKASASNLNRGTDDSKSESMFKNIFKSKSKPLTPNEQALVNYKNQINDLINEFDEKEEYVVELIETRFPNSSITYNKFIGVVNGSHNNFFVHADSALSIIKLVPEFNPKVDYELKKKVNILKSIIKKFDELTSELVISINEDKKADDDFNFLLQEMEDLVDSVKEYK